MQGEEQQKITNQEKESQILYQGVHKEDPTESALGTHYLIEFYNCDHEVIDSIDDVQHHLFQSVLIAGATPLKKMFHKFSPQGVSGVIVIAESHFSLHTWPEHRFCAVDMFSCGDKLAFEKAITYLQQHLKAKTFQVIKIQRGLKKIVQQQGDGTIL